MQSLNFEYTMYLLPDFISMYVHVNRKDIFLVIVKLFKYCTSSYNFFKQIKPRKTLSRFVVTNGEFLKGKGWKLGLFLLFR